MAQLVPWRGRRGALSPFDQMRREFDRLFDRAFGAFPALPEEAGNEMRVWDFNVEDREKEVVVRAELPGFEPNEVDVSLSDNVLTIKAEEQKKAEGQETYRSFLRSVTLPPGLDADKAQASFKNGVLELHLPKTEQAASKRIPVQGQEHQALPRQGQQGATGQQAKGPTAKKS